MSPSHEIHNEDPRAARGFLQGVKMKKYLMGMHPDNRYRAVKWPVGKFTIYMVIFGVVMLALSIWIHTGGAG